MNFYELQVVITETELIVNSRPLSQLYDDDIDEILTPNHLLFGRKLYQANPFVHTLDDEDNVNICKRVNHLDSVIEHFWNRWKSEYVTSLREYQKSFKSKNHLLPSTDDIVLVYDEKLPRQHWLLGKIIELLPSDDNQIRGAKVLLGRTKNIIERPLNRLYPLETNYEFVNKKKEDTMKQQSKIKTRTERNAAKLANIRIMNT